MDNKQKIWRAAFFIMVSLFLVFIGILIGFDLGIDRAAKSARLVEYSNSGYVIEYDYTGAHSYN